MSPFFLLSLGVLLRRRATFLSQYIFSFFPPYHRSHTQPAAAAAADAPPDNIHPRENASTSRGRASASLSLLLSFRSLPSSLAHSGARWGRRSSRRYSYILYARAALARSLALAVHCTYGYYRGRLLTRKARSRSLVCVCFNLSRSPYSFGARVCSFIHPPPAPARASATGYLTSPLVLGRPPLYPRSPSHAAARREREQQRLRRQRRQRRGSDAAVPRSSSESSRARVCVCV